MLLTVTRLITAALLIGSAAAFAAGAAIEHHTATSEQHAAGGEHGTAPHAEAGQRSEKPATSEHAPGREGSAHAAELHSETLLGINPESTGLVVTAVAISLALAALILTVGSPLLAAGVALAMLAFTALDIRELTHQLNSHIQGWPRSPPQSPHCTSSPQAPRYSPRATSAPGPASATRPDRLSGSPGSAPEKGAQDHAPPVARTRRQEQACGCCPG